MRVDIKKAVHMTMDDNLTAFQKQLISNMIDEILELRAKGPSKQFDLHYPPGAYNPNGMIWGQKYQ